MCGFEKSSDEVFTNIRLSENSKFLDVTFSGETYYSANTVAY